jgi:hypothetical protein
MGPAWEDSAVVLRQIDSIGTLPATRLTKKVLISFHDDSKRAQINQDFGIPKHPKQVQIHALADDKTESWLVDQASRSSARNNLSSWKCC